MSCATDHGRWSEPGVPHKGWTDEYVDDLGEPSFTCEMCESATIRYAHHMTHPDYPQELICGVVCAERMTEDYANPRRMEREARNRSARDKRQRARQTAGLQREERRQQAWLDAAWATSARGNLCLGGRDWFLVVFRATIGWKAMIHFKATGEKRWPGPFLTADEAKLAVWRLLGSPDPPRRWRRFVYYDGEPETGGDDS